MNWRPLGGVKNKTKKNIKIKEGGLVYSLPASNVRKACRRCREPRSFGHRKFHFAARLHSIAPANCLKVRGFKF